MADFEQVESIQTSVDGEMKGLLQLRISGASEPLAITCPSFASADDMADLIDGYCRLVNGGLSSLWNRKGEREGEGGEGGGGREPSLVHPSRRPADLRQGQGWGRGGGKGGGGGGGGGRGGGGGGGRGGGMADRPGLVLPMRGIGILQRGNVSE